MARQVLRQYFTIEIDSPGVGVNGILQTEFDGSEFLFLAGEDVKKVISVSDAVTTDDNGAAIGLVRVVTYKTRDKDKD